MLQCHYFSFFELWKMLRMYLYFYVVYNYVNSFEQFKDFMLGIALVTIYIFFEVMKQNTLRDDSNPMVHFLIRIRW